MDGTTGKVDWKVDWKVRVEYVMPHKSVDQSLPQDFVMLFHVVAENAVDAWTKALMAFPVELVIEKKIYQREEMRVWIES